MDNKAPYHKKRHLPGFNQTQQMGSSRDTMMRIAIAGSSGLARIIAYNIEQTAHQFVILSRYEQPVLTDAGYQVMVVNYDSQEDLRFTLRGIDLVISTVSGAPQINLIDAAAHAGVRRFVPAEFEGPPTRRPRHSQDDPLDRGKAESLDRLRYWQSQHRCVMRFTIFTCGVFYERFARGGLATLLIGSSTGMNDQGSYLMDIGNSTAEIVARSSNSGRDAPIYISLISVQDVGRFIAAAIELDPTSWPGELRMAGERRSIAEVLQWAEAIKGGALFSTDIIQNADLQAHLDHASYYEDYVKVHRIQELMATVQRRYDFEGPNLNTMVNITPVPFWDWLRTEWGGL